MNCFAKFDSDRLIDVTYAMMYDFDMHLSLFVSVRKSGLERLYDLQMCCCSTYVDAPYLLQDSFNEELYVLSLNLKCVLCFTSVNFRSLFQMILMLTVAVIWRFQFHQ